jgi:hypothetical protein
MPRTIFHSSPSSPQPAAHAHVVSARTGWHARKREWGGMHASGNGVACTQAAAHKAGGAARPGDQNGI